MMTVVRHSTLDTPCAALRREELPGADRGFARRSPTGRREVRRSPEGALPVQTGRLESLIVHTARRWRVRMAMVARRTVGGVAVVAPLFVAGPLSVSVP